mmetsp:Transcript_18958/g.44413  ORF Transcript_18958/g.44413 Transcript_18958/m.44413 type:complete len:207 (+) Transcript_18958:161-781(+)
MAKFFLRFFSVFVDPPGRSLLSHFSRPSMIFSSLSALLIRLRLASAIISTLLTAPLMWISSSSLSMSESLISANSSPLAFARFNLAARRGSRRARCWRLTSFCILANSAVEKIRVEDISCWSLARSFSDSFVKSSLFSDMSPSSAFSSAPVSFSSIIIRSGASPSLIASSSFTWTSSSPSDSPASCHPSLPSASSPLSLFAFFAAS